MSATAEQFRRAARQYLKHGLHPIPCCYRAKTPQVSWKLYQSVAPSERDLEIWWPNDDGYPANIAVVLGRGLMALDVDGQEGLVALREAGLPVQELLEQDVPTVRTRKGLHLYFRGECGDRVNLLPKVDVRGVGYVIAPPSVHPEGHEYRWVTGLEAGIKPMPDRLGQLLFHAAVTKPMPAVSAGEYHWAARMLRDGVDSGRNHGMAKLVGRYWKLGATRDECEVIARVFIERSRGDHEFTEQEFQATLNSITSREGGPR